MGKVVARIPNSSNPGKAYEIMLSNDGTVYYCSCWAWKKNRGCKHLQQFLAREPVVEVPLKPTSDLETAVQQAVATIRNR